MILRKTGRWATALGALWMFCSPAGAGVQELVQETQRTVTADGQVTMVWWMPREFWDESLKASAAAMPDALRAQILAMVENYNILAVMRGRTGALGLTDVQPKAEMQQNISVEFDGQVVAPLAPDQLDPAAQLLLAQLKPGLAATIGQMGQAMEFLVYPGKVGEGRLADPAKPGELKVAFYGNTLRFRLPLGSLLPPSIDGKTGEQFPGNYRFNPFTGDRLTTR